jgi:NADP-dependent 3-hydroxy acid dehydrogenase YdfG
LASLETARAELIALHPQTNIIPIPADVGSKESVAALWKQLSEKDVKVDVLINNAGRGGAHAKIGEGDVDEWWEVQVRFWSWLSVEKQSQRLEWELTRYRTRISSVLT